MKLRRTALAFAALCLAGRVTAQAPATGQDSLGKFSDIPIDIAAEKLDASGELATASGNVQIAYGATTIYCDEAQYNPATRDVIASGRVRIYRDGQLFTAERAVYNLESKDISAASIHGDTGPFFFSGNSFQNIQGTNGYLVKEGLFTTSDSLQPDWSLRARRVRIYKNDRIILTDVKLYVGTTPVFWFPYVYQSLNQKDALSITPGYRSVWGAYALTNYSFPLTEDMAGTLRLDILSKRGPAIGLNTAWAPKEDGGKNWGRFTSYALRDGGADINQTTLAREPIAADRYRASLQARQYLTEDIYATVDINKLSDTRLLEDFFEEDFRRQSNPDNALSLTKFGDDYTMTLLARKQINDFFDGTERLPEVALDITRQPFFGSKVFYEGETTAGYYDRNFAKDSTLQDYSFTRVDSFHQLLMPGTYFGWLSVVPRVGARGTWYSESGGSGSLGGQPVQQGDLFRLAINTGVEVSFKASKVYEGAQSRALGLDGIRHIIQPYANLSFVHTDHDLRDVLRIDNYQSSTRLAPIDFPAFGSIDSIDNWNILRLGVRNRLQTRRDNTTFNWLELDSFFDVRFDRPDFGGLDPDQGGYSNLVNRLRWAPVPWANLTIDSQIPAFDTGFSEFNSQAYFLVNDRASFTVGHRYLGQNSLFTNSSLLDVGGYLRFDENWAFSFQGSYEFRDHILESQRYNIYRDLSSWVASLGFIARNNGSSAKSQNDFGVILTFTLKDLPDLRLPISFDPTGQGGSGTGKNR